VISVRTTQGNSPLPAASRIMWVNSTRQESSSLVIGLFALSKYWQTDGINQKERSRNVCKQRVSLTTHNSGGVFFVLRPLFFSNFRFLNTAPEQKGGISCC